MSPSPPSLLVAPRADAAVPAYRQALGLPGMADIHLHFLPERTRKVWWNKGARLLGLEYADA